MRFTATLEEMQNPFFMEAMRKQAIYEGQRDDWRRDHPPRTKEDIQHGEEQRKANRLQAS